ncbi:MAG: V-type ATP synthase subunit E family protein [Candidatus Bathyarchaeia archaeon]
MGITEMRSQIEKETEREIQEIIQKAEAEAKAIIEEAERKAEELLRDEKKRRTAELLARRRAEIAILRMNQRTELMKVKAQWLERAFEEAERRLAEKARGTNSDSFRRFITGLIVEGAAKIKGSKIFIQSDGVTASFLKKNKRSIEEAISNAKQENVEIHLEIVPDMPVGVIIRSADKRQYFNNTLEARLSETRKSLSGEIYSLLFKEAS